VIELINELSRAHPRRAMSAYHSRIYINDFVGDSDMNNLAEKLETIFAVETDHIGQLDCDVVEIGSQRPESLSLNYFEELDAWARHSVGLNGFGDY
jgi:hypothetical protein